MQTKIFLTLPDVAQMLQKKNSTSHAKYSIPRQYCLSHWNMLPLLLDVVTRLYFFYFSFLKFPFSLCVECIHWTFLSIPYVSHWASPHIWKKELLLLHVSRNDALCFISMLNGYYIYTYTTRSRSSHAVSWLWFIDLKKMKLYFLNIWMNEWWVYKGHKGHMKCVLCILNSFKKKIMMNWVWFWIILII